MREAIALAVANVREGRGGPFAAVVVRDGRIVARAANQVTTLNDPTAHAEVLAIRAACQDLNAYHLTGCTLYATCEPCPMCMGAVYWARLDRVFYAASREDAALAGFDDEFMYEELRRPPARRRIPMRQISYDAAQEPFKAWMAAPDRTPY